MSSCFPDKVLKYIGVIFGGLTNFKFIVCPVDVFKRGMLFGGKSLPFIVLSSGIFNKVFLAEVTRSQQIQSVVKRIDANRCATLPATQRNKSFQ